MMYERDLDYDFYEEAKKRGIDVDQLPSGEQHIYCREMEKQLDQHLNILAKIYFDQMEKRGFKRKVVGSAEQHKRATDSILKGLGVTTPLSPEQDLIKDNIEHEKRYENQLDRCTCSNIGKYNRYLDQIICEDCEARLEAEWHTRDKY